MTDYLIFLAKFCTILVGVVTLFITIAMIKLKTKKIKSQGNIEIKNLNDHYDDIKLRMMVESSDKSEQKEYLKKLKKNKKKKDKPKKKVYFLRFNGDIKANAVDSLKEEINAILSVACKTDQIVVAIESPGGAVSGYGLAASELARFKSRGLHVTALVDKVAASGGYMMATIADEIVAAPFAIIGSIGVLAQIPNFYKLLAGKGIEVEQIMSGKYKRTLTMFGKNSNEARGKMQKELNNIHQQFKDLIKLHRPDIDINKVSTGEYWLASQAVDLGLVDRLMTSEEYLQQLFHEGKEVFSIIYKKELQLSEKICNSFINFKNIFSPFS